ncbi:hypothetical protein BC943DRAFT_337330 [Umbelopsis sp. AD052]|nr:hypothetical protein BC943DRAFT_337330 [Umbelopsis sp. AD052]
MYRHYPLKPPIASSSPFSQESSMDLSDLKQPKKLYDMEYWLACFDSLTSTMYNSPAAVLPSFPHHHYAIPLGDKKDQIGTERGESQSDPNIPNSVQENAFHNRNDEYFTFQNFYEFRQARCDHVMGRLRLHFRFPALTIRRLQAGNYILHQSSPEGQAVDPTTGTLDDKYTTEAMVRARRSTMTSFGVTMSSLNARTRFVPYSFSIGARYCSPYRVHDILLRCAHLPNWGHTIFMLNAIAYMKEYGPVESGKVVTGLFKPFAPAIDVTFRWLTNEHFMSGQEPFPLALLIFEHLAFDTTEEQDMDILLATDGTPQDGKNAKNQMQLARFPVLWVELGDGMAQHLTGLANHWLEKSRAEGTLDMEME